MSSLARFDNDGIELMIDTPTGESFASISAVARMTDESRQSISSYVDRELTTRRGRGLEDAEDPTTADFIKSVRLLNEEQILEEVIRVEPDLLNKLAACGLRIYLHRLAGYKDPVVEQFQYLETVWRSWRDRLVKPFDGFD